MHPPAADASRPCLELLPSRGSHIRWPADSDADGWQSWTSSLGSAWRSTLPRGSRARTFLSGCVTCSFTEVCQNTSAATLVRVRWQVRPGVAGPCWREDVVYRAAVTVGEWLLGELLSSCAGTSCLSGKRSTRCSRPMCSSSGGDSTTTPSGRTLPLGIARGPQRRCSPVRLLRLRLRNRTGLVCWRSKT